MEKKHLKKLEGKTIKTIKFPNSLLFDGTTRNDDNVLITFTDDTILKLGSWDYEGYSSGIDKEIIIK